MIIWNVLVVSKSGNPGSNSCSKWSNIFHDSCCFCRINRLNSVKTLKGYSRSEYFCFFCHCRLEATTEQSTNRASSSSAVQNTFDLRYTYSFYLLLGLCCTNGWGDCSWRIYVLYVHNLKVWHHIENLLCSSMHICCGEQSCQISFRSDLKWRNFRLFWRALPEQLMSTQNKEIKSIRKKNANTDCVLYHKDITSTCMIWSLIILVGVWIFFVFSGLFNFFFFLYCKCGCILGRR